MRRDGQKEKHCPFSRSLCTPLSYSLNILPISDFNQVFSHHDNPGSTRQQSGSPQWDFLLFPLFPSPFCPFSCSFSCHVRCWGVVFTLDFSHLYPRLARDMSACLSEDTFAVEWWKLAIRRLIWSCQTYQSCLPAYLTFSDYDNHAWPVWRDRILLECKIPHPPPNHRNTHTPMPVYISHQPPLQTKVLFSEALSFKRVLVSSVSALNVIWFIQSFAAAATEWDSELMSTSRAHAEHNNDRIKKLSGFGLKWSPWGWFSLATYFTGYKNLIIIWLSDDSSDPVNSIMFFSLSDNGTGSYLIIRNQIRSPWSLTNTLMHVYPLRWLMSFFNLCTSVKNRTEHKSYKNSFVVL